MIVFLTALLAASAMDETFDRAVQSYYEGDYTACTNSLELLVQQGVADEAVFYNLGNAYYRNAYLGPAIANYERALAINPSMEDARENLFRAVNRTERRLSRPLPSEWEQSLLFWHYGLSPATSNLLAGLCWVSLWVALGIRQAYRLPYLRRAALGAALLTAAFTASSWVKANPQQTAVAAAKRVPVHYGTHEDEQTVRFELYEGDRVLVDQREGGWVRIVTSEKERGWAREELLTLVGPPFESPSLHESLLRPKEPAS